MTDKKKKELTIEELEAILEAVAEATGRRTVMITPDMSDEEVSSVLEELAGEQGALSEERKKKEMLH